MARLKAEITKEIIVELDEAFFNDAFNEHYSRYFSDAYSLEDHAENIAWAYSKFGQDNLEGYGYPLVNGEKHWRHRSDESIVYNKAINIIDEEEQEVQVWEA